MATIRYKGHCKTSALEDGDRADAVITPMTASVAPLAGNIPSTPPRNKQVLGLPTPLATPDSRLRVGSRFTSPPRTPTRHPDVPKNTTALTVSGTPSERHNDQSIIPFLPPPGLLTPDNTPPRLSKPRFAPISHKEETKDKSKLSLSLEITSTVVETSETSEHHAESIQNIGKPKPVTTQCNGITKKTKRQCSKSVKAPNRYCIYHIDQDPGAPPNLSANVRGPQRRQSKDIVVRPTIVINSQCRGLTLRGIQCQRSVKLPAQYCHQHTSQSTNTPTTPTAPKPTTDVNSQCRGLTLRGTPCQRSVKPPAQYCHQHRSQSNNALTTLTISTAQKTVQCSAKSNSNGRRCQQQVSITLGQLTMDASKPIYCRHHIPALVGIVTHVENKGFKVQSVGQEEVFVHFCDYIPEYLQPDTQQKLRKAITGKISERFRKPGYVYALNVFDPETKGKLSLKIGYSNDVKKRHAQWKNQCRSSIRDVRGWWPQTIIEDKDDDEISIKELIEKNRQGIQGPMAEQLERLVHIELMDLATHAPYVHPNFPNVHFSDIPRLPKVVPQPCRDCIGVKHKEVFSFKRVKEGEFFGREWEDIIKPVIRKWGLFLMKYFAQDRMSFANDSRI